MADTCCSPPWATTPWSWVRWPWPASRSVAARSEKRYRVEPTYSEIVRFSFGEIVVGEKGYDRDIYIPVSGKVKARDKDVVRPEGENSHAIGQKELEEVCKGGPEVLFVGCPKANNIVLTEQAQRYLNQRSIRCGILPAVHF